jgi:hypothetical protein
MVSSELMTAGFIRFSVGAVDSPFTVHRFYPAQHSTVNCAPRGVSA